MPEAPADLIGLGLYSVPEASRLTGVSAGRIRRWLAGYTYHRDGVAHRSEPLWYPEVPRLDGTITLSFRDLAEVRVVGALAAQGFGMRSIRRAMIHGRDLLGDERPFSTARFKTDGKRLFIEITRDTDEPALFDPKARAYVFHRFIAPSFKDFDVDAEAVVRWWPLGHGHHVLLDPQRAFGQPVVDEGSIPTAILRDAVAAEGSVGVVARLYDVPEPAVRAALRFEERQAA